MKFNKHNVFAIYTFYKTVGHIFVTDVMYHKNCMTNPIKFQRDVNEISDDNDEHCDIRMIREVILEMFATL